MKRTAGARESEVYLMPVALSIVHEFDLFGNEKKESSFDSSPGGFWPFVGTMERRESIGPID